MLYKKLNTPHQQGEPEPSHRGHAGLHGHDRGEFEGLRVVIEGTGGFNWVSDGFAERRSREKG